MKLRILAVGHNMPNWINAGVDEYLKRMPRDCRLELLEITPIKRNKSTPIAKAMQLEAQAIEKHLDESQHTIALEVLGQPWSTEQLAKKMSTWQQTGRHLNFIIGGADGLTPELSNQANEKWSLSNLTLPHPLVRVLLAEQLYRAWSLLNNHPYHR